MNAVRSLILLWRNVGPYHLARSVAAARAFRERGFETTAIELCDTEELRDWKVAKGGTELPILTLDPGGTLTGSTRDHSSRLREYLESLNPSVVAIAGYDRPEMRTALRWCRERGAVGVLMSETKWDDRPRRWWKQWLTSRIVRMASAGLVSGAPAAEYLISLGLPRERVFTQYGVVDNDYFSDEKLLPVRPAEVPPGEYFLACSRLIEDRKNISRLLIAYSEYRRTATGNPWSLVVCGDGPDRERYLAQVRDLGVPGVLFVGFKQIQELVHYYRCAGCFVHPAVNEAWGLVVNEAMASGCPVLVSKRCGCAHDLVSPGENGYTFDPYDVTALAKRLGQMAQLPAEVRARMGTASQAIIARWGPERFASGLLEAARIA